MSGRNVGGLLPVALGVAVVLSLTVGAESIAPGTVWDAVVHGSTSPDALIVRDLRVPRTVLGVVTGAALGLAGALMQTLTRNPLADPGLLGVNAGAAAAVVIGISALGVTTPSGYVWLALLGAGVASAAVYALGSRGRANATAVRMTLAGAAITAVLTAVIYGVTLVDQTAFDSYRIWSVGTLAGRPLDVLSVIGPLLLAGMVLGLALARPLDALALGEDGGSALGANLARTRLLGALATTVLCGASTAAIGPIGFLGLAVPHLARALAGPHHRRLLPYSMLLAPTVLLTADVLGRIVARPGELQVGLVTAFLGAPILIALARRRRLVTL